MRRGCLGPEGRRALGSADAGQQGPAALCRAVAGARCGRSDRGRARGTEPWRSCGVPEHFGRRR
eukprot:13886831-Alexandrium_andersonii.AAC.1